MAAGSARELVNLIDLTAIAWSHGGVQRSTIVEHAKLDGHCPAPAGDYQVLQFQTHFATKPEAVEAIVLAREKQAGMSADTSSADLRDALSVV